MVGNQEKFKRKMREKQNHNTQKKGKNSGDQCSHDG